MRDFSGLDALADRGLRKEAGVLPEPTSVAGGLGQAALYAVPFVGSGLNIADGIKNILNGHPFYGLADIGLGIGTGIADFFSFGTAGSALRGLRGASAAAKGIRAANSTRKALAAGKFFPKLSARAGQTLGKTWAGRRAIEAGKLFGGYVGLTPYSTVRNRMFERAIGGENGLFATGVGALSRAVGGPSQESIDAARPFAHAMTTYLADAGLDPRIRWGRALR